MTRATLRFTASGRGACVTASTLSEEPFQDLWVEGGLRLQTDDGRVDARWPSTLAVNGVDKDGRVTGAGVWVDGRDLPDGDTATPAELGFPEEDRGPHDELSVFCDVSLNDRGEHGGSIQLNAYDDMTDCDPATPGCVGSSIFTSLERGDVVPEP